MFTELELAYIAGFFDGEGCIHVARMVRGERGIQHEIRVTIAQVAPCPILEELHSYYGGSIARQERKRPVLFWALNGMVVQAFLTDIMPFIREKKPQAEVALEWFSRERPKRGRGVRMSDEEFAYREGVWRKLKELKGH